MIPWSYLSAVRQVLADCCGLNFRMLFVPELGFVRGVEIDDSGALTVRIAEKSKSGIRLSMLHSPKSKSAMLVLTDPRTGAQNAVGVWCHEGDGRAMLSTRGAFSPARIPAFTHRRFEGCEGDMTVATQGDQKYVLILSSRMEDNSIRRRSFLTTTCDPDGADVQWAIQYMHFTTPETVGRSITPEFFAAASLDVFNVKNTPEAEAWWVYLDGSPKRVTSAEAVSLARESRVHHVCRDGMDWQTLQDAGLL